MDNVQKHNSCITHSSSWILSCIGSDIVMMNQYPSCQLTGRFLRIASRSFKRTSQYDAEFTFSSRSWKCVISTPRTVRDVARTDPFGSFFFSILQISGACTVRNFKWSCTMLYAKPWEHPSAVATLSIVILRSAQINSSTCCTVASVGISTGRPGRATSVTLQTSLREFCDTLVNRFTREELPTANPKHFFMNIFYTEPFCPQITHKSRQARSPFWLLKPASEHVHARPLPRLSWRWTVLLPSETHRKPITFITAVLLPFVTY
jgi:hypothetical protein